MIQCERCSAWQHVDCVGICPGHEPERYHCFACVKQQSAYENGLAGTRWLRAGRKRVDDVPILPTSAKDVSWSSDTLDRVLEPRPRKQEPAHVQQLLMTQRNIASDLASLERVLRASRVTISTLSRNSSDSSRRKVRDFHHQSTRSRHLFSHSSRAIPSSPPRTRRDILSSPLRTGRAPARPSIHACVLSPRLSTYKNFFTYLLARSHFLRAHSLT
jgi:hypothetical protein